MHFFVLKTFFFFLLEMHIMKPNIAKHLSEVATLATCIKESKLFPRSNIDKHFAFLLEGPS